MSDNHVDAGGASSGEVSQLLEAWSRREPGARDRLLPLLYQELRGLAQHYMRGERSGGIAPTSSRWPPR